MIQALTLLTMALQLLVAANQPHVPVSIKLQAASVANLAIRVANKVLEEESVNSVSKSLPVKITSPESPEIIKYPFEVIPIKTFNTIETNQSGLSINIPTIFLGSFKIRTNSNTEIRWYDCNVSLSEPTYKKTSFGSYKLTGFVGGGNNNCFINTSLTKTDKDGFTEEIGLYINDLSLSIVNNPSSIRKIRVYLNDITIREVTNGAFHRTTSPLVFDLEVIRY